MPDVLKQRAAAIAELIRADALAEPRQSVPLRLTLEVARLRGEGQVELADALASLSGEGSAK